MIVSIHSYVIRNAEDSKSTSLIKIQNDARSKYVLLIIVSIALR